MTTGDRVLTGRVGQIITWTCRHPQHAAQQGKGAFTIPVADLLAAFSHVEQFLIGEGLPGKEIIAGVVTTMQPRNAFKRGVHKLRDKYHVKMIGKEDPIVKATKKNPNPPPAFLRFQFHAESHVQYQGREELAYARETVLSLNKVTAVVTDEDPPIVPQKPAPLPAPVLPPMPQVPPRPAPLSDDATPEEMEGLAVAHDAYDAARVAYNNWEVDCDEIMTAHEALEREETQAYRDAISDYQAKVQIRADLLRKATDAVRDCMGNRTGRDISRYIETLFRRARTFCVPLSAFKGIFFVGQEHIALVEAVDMLLTDVGGKITRIDVAQTDGNKQSIGDAIKEKLASLVQEHEAAVAKFSGKTRKGTMENAAQEIILTRTRMNAYLSWLEGEAVAQFRLALDECDERVREAIEKVSKPKPRKGKAAQQQEEEEPELQEAV